MGGTLLGRSTFALIVSLRCFPPVTDLEVSAEMAAQEVADHAPHRKVEWAEAVQAHLNSVHVLHLEVCDGSEEKMKRFMELQQIVTFMCHTP